MRKASFLFIAFNQIKTFSTRKQIFFFLLFTIMSDENISNVILIRVWYTTLDTQSEPLVKVSKVKQTFVNVPDVPKCPGNVPGT
jgi:hypothetical protein